MDKTTGRLIKELEERMATVVAGIEALKAYLMGEESQQPDESDAERQFRERIGPFLNAIDKAGGSVTAEEFGDLGRQFGYDPRGLGGFATGANPSIRSEGDRRVLTPRGKALSARWLALES